MNFDSGSRMLAGALAIGGAAGEGIDAPLRASAALDGTSAAASFVDSIADAVRATDSKARDAADKMAAVDSGQSDDLVGAMLASQEANLSFSLLMQVRNKVVGAVDELIKLQL